MVRKHEGIFICGYCKKETPLSDDILLNFIENGLIYRVWLSIENECCTTFSSESKVRFKAQINKKDWQGWMRGSAE